MKIRYAFIVSFVILFTAVFAARLLQWQVFQSDHYKKLAASSTTLTIPAKALRGEIFDVNGVGLAVNLTGYRVVFNRLFIDEDKLNENILRLVEIMELCGEKWIDELPIRVDSSGRFSFDENMQDETGRLREREDLDLNPYSSAPECMSQLVEQYDCSGYSPTQQRDIVSVRYNMELKGFSNTEPYIFADGLSSEAMSAVSERMNDVRGVTVESTAVRTYTNGTAAPHIVGVTGAISAEEYSELKSQGYGFNDRLGKSGIESAFESSLRGSDGSRTYELDSDGNIRLREEINTKPGNSIYLTIDSRLQSVAQDALKDAVKEANDYSRRVGDKSMGADCKGAAAVVLKVKDFSVLCAANYPSFDLSLYYEDYTSLSSDENAPLFDRAFMGALTPGSTFKPLVAAAALQERKITAKTTIRCDGVYTTGGLKLWCMGFHGEQDLYDAMIHSCNVFFAETGRLVGIENIEKYARRCGLGVKTGVEVTESAGTLAGPEYSSIMGSQWYSGFVSPAAIGQSDNQFTPLQLASYAATIANDGKRLKTHVVDRIVSYSGNEIVYQSVPELAEEMGVSPENLKEVQRSMNLAADSYDALSDFEISVAGKTGTAENSGSDHANFICYAPYDDPQIAVCVMVEHGAKSFVAINAAKKIMNAYFREQEK